MGSGELVAYMRVEVEKGTTIVRAKMYNSMDGCLRSGGEHGLDARFGAVAIVLQDFENFIHR